MLAGKDDFQLLLRNGDAPRDKILEVSCFGEDAVGVTIHVKVSLKSEECTFDVGIDLDDIRDLIYWAYCLGRESK
jgi:hypothetical protein